MSGSNGSTRDWVLRWTPMGARAAARRLLPDAAVRRLRRVLHRGGGQADSGTGALRRDVLMLEYKLWGGYAEYARADLEALRIAPTTLPREAQFAARVLARYYAACGDHYTALDRIAFVRAGSARAAAGRANRFIEINSLLALGQVEHARFLLEKALGGGASANADADVLMAGVHRVEALSGAVEPERARRAFFDCLSRPLERAGIVGITTSAGAGEAPALGNLAAAETPPAPASMGPKVSVLMAAFNAEDNIETAIRSVLDQSWRNLEVVVTDDASTDNTWAVIQRLASADERVVPLRHEVNGGAYMARNTGLEQATGDYVVVNDADDWAHPQKIELQVRDMEAHGGAGANLTYRLRVDGDLVPVLRLDSPHVPVIHNDFSALMVARERVLELGGWDPVRFSADAEFVKRLRVAEGGDPVRKLHAGVPVSISLFEATNLTASSATSIWTNRFGAREEYERAFDEWHATADSMRMDRTSQTAPYPVPGLAYNAPGTRQRFDVILVSDFRLPGGTTQCNLHYLQALREAGYSVARVHWGRYDVEPRDSGRGKIDRACRELGVVPLVHGEEASCRLLLIHHPPVMMWQPDAVPSIHAERIALVANQSSQRVKNGPHELYEPATVQARVEENFGRQGIWIPISPVVRRQMREAGGFDPVWHEDWLPVLALGEWSCERRWRGGERERPVIGRHSRDHWIKWPGTAEEIAAAYCAGQPVDVRIMGGADTALNLLGHKPSNWEVLPFDAESTREFLAGLDIYIHFIHGESIEAFGRNVMEAMAMGVPVVCSPSFRECFGDAAIYARPDEVHEAVAALWYDRDRYLACGEAGRAYVLAHCDYAAVTGRVSEMLADSPPFQTVPPESVVDGAS